MNELTYGEVGSESSLYSCSEDVCRAVPEDCLRLWIVEFEERERAASDERSNDAQEERRLNGEEE